MQLPLVNNLISPVLGAVFTLIGSVIIKLLNDIRHSIGVYKQEHDVLWEDYNIRTGGGWRRGMSRVRNGITRRMKVKVT